MRVQYSLIRPRGGDDDDDEDDSLPQFTVPQLRTDPEKRHRQEDPKSNRRRKLIMAAAFALVFFAVFFMMRSPAASSALVGRGLLSSLNEAELLNSDDPYLLRAKALPSDQRFRPTIVNGRLGAIVETGAFSMGGLYNGERHHSHLAALPLPIDFAIEALPGQHIDAEWVQMRLDTGTFEHVYVVRNLTTQRSVNITKSIFAHRQDYLGNLIVIDVRMESELSFDKIEVKAIPYVVDEDQLTSADVQFASTVRDDEYFRHMCSASGTTKTPELPHAGKQNVSLMWTCRYSGNLRLWTGGPEYFLIGAGVDYDEAFASVIRGMQVDLYLLDLHQAAWRRQWREASIRVPSNVSLARDINAALYYLTSEAPASLAMTRQRRFFGIPPAGVSRTGEGNYNGHIFWDQDTWMQPAIMSLYPHLSAAVMRSRIDALQSAMDNARRLKSDGARYPWESARTGIDVSPPLFTKLEVHVTCDVAVALMQQLRQSAPVNGSFVLESSSEYAEGNSPSAAEMAFQIAHYWSTRSTLSDDGRTAHIKGVMGPDEYHKPVDDSVYTNYCARLALQLPLAICNRFSSVPNRPSFCVENATALDAWSARGAKLVILNATHDGSTYHPEFAGFSPERNAPVKQADAILLGYPLQMPMSPEERRADLDIYLPITDSDGPAMSSSMFAVGYLESASGKARADALADAVLQRHVNGPFRVWSETARAQAGFPGAVNFLTGIGGFVQSLVYGYAGARYYDDFMLLRPQALWLNQSYSVDGLAYCGARFLVDVQSATEWRLMLISAPTSLDDLEEVSVEACRQRQSDCVTMSVGDALDWSGAAYVHVSH